MKINPTEIVIAIKDLEAFLAGQPVSIQVDPFTQAIGGMNVKVSLGADSLVIQKV